MEIKENLIQSISVKSERFSKDRKTVNPLNIVNNWYISFTDRESSIQALRREMGTSGS